MDVTFLLNCDCDSVTIELIITLLYQAFERLANLVANSEGIAVDGEVGICLHFLEKEVEGAVCPTGERDVLAVEEARISPTGGWRERLDEREAILFVASQLARILLAKPGDEVRAQDGSQVHTKFCVTVPTLEVGI